MTYGTENYVPPTAPTENPGKTMGIVGLVLGIVGFGIAFLGPIAGLIVSIIGLNKSRRAGQKNGFAVAGIIVSAIALIVNVIALVAIISFAASVGGTATELVQQCQANPTGTVEFQGEQINCADLVPAD